MIICMCQRVSDRDITYMSRSGASFDDLQLELRADDHAPAKPHVRTSVRLNQAAGSAAD